MATSDLIADFLTIVRNGQKAGSNKVEARANKSVVSISSILKEKGYIGDYKENTDKHKNLVSLQLRYSEEGEPLIKKIERVSKPSRRVYSRAQEIPRVANGYATVIISTPAGIMTGKQARESKQGGEILCYVI